MLYADWLKQIIPLFSRIQLSKSSECAGNAVQIMEVMFQSLVEDFTDYALEVGLQVYSYRSAIN